MSLSYVLNVVGKRYRWDVIIALLNFLCLSEWTFHVTWDRSKKMSELKCEIFFKITMKYEQVMKIVEARKNEPSP